MVINMGQEFFKYLEKISPPIFWSGLVLLIGIIFSAWIVRLVITVLERWKLNQLFKRIGLEEALAKIDTRLNASKFFGEIVRWFFIILFFTFSIEILAIEISGLAPIYQFFEKIVGYFANIFIACLIFLVAAFLSDLSQKMVVATLEKEKITYSRFLGREISWAIWILAILAILYQLKIVPHLILTIFIGVVITLSITIGISFGLSGKDLAAKILKELEEKFK